MQTTQAYIEGVGEKEVVRDSDDLRLAERQRRVVGDGERPPVESGTVAVERDTLLEPAGIGSRSSHNKKQGGGGINHQISSAKYRIANKKSGGKRGGEGSCAHDLMMAGRTVVVRRP